MKRCQKCNFESGAMLDYCWQCGTPLANVSNAGNFYQGAPPTQEYSLPNAVPPFNGHGQNYGQNYAPNYPPRPSAVSFGRVAAVLGGIIFVLLFVSGIAGFAVYKIVSRPPAPRYGPDYRYRNPEPVRPAVRETPASDPRKTNEPGAKLEKLWVDYNVRENGRSGMRIHVKFSVYNMKNVDSDLAIYFEKADGTKLKTTGRKFATRDGQVAVFRALKPGFDDTVFEDLTLFMPYDELKLGRGNYDLKMDADVIYRNGDMVEHLGYHEFRYEKN